MSNTTLSIIIVNYNTFALTIDCLASIYKQPAAPHIAFELILVDNASTECDPKLFLEKFPQIKLIENKDNVGFGVANNQGMELATGEFMLLLNSDTIVLDQALWRSVEQLQKRLANPATADIALLGCELLNSDHSHQTSFWMYDETSILDAIKQALHYSIWYSKIESFFQRRKAPKPAPVLPQKAEEKPYLVNGLYGAFVLLHRRVYEQTKGFDPDFFLYCEETEWFRNRISKQFQMEYFPDAKVIHLIGKSSQKLQTISSQRLASAFLYWYKRGYGLYWTFVLVCYLGLLGNFLLYPFVSALTRKQIMAFVKVTPVAFWEIPRYSRAYGSRPRFLRL